MSFLNDIYYKSLAENEKNIRFWQDYLNNLKSLDFSVFADKLKVPALVPIGSRIFFRGELKHTNELTVALGADYFAKCSLKQAEVLRQHRITDAHAKLDIFVKERKYLENRVSFSEHNVFEGQGQEIIEEYSEKEDKEWRKRHKENIREHKQRKTKENSTGDSEGITDEELWNRLEELELQEELESEYLSSGEVQENIYSIENPFIIKEEYEKELPRIVEQQTSVKRMEETVAFTEDVANKQTSKFDILQKVLDKQNELEEKLIALRHKERSQSKSEKDLISKVDEMEELDELEDEMDRLDDILQTEDVDSDEETVSVSSQIKLKKGVSFADDDSETLELTFSHSNVEPCKEPYNEQKGIVKPSDIYKAYSNSFSPETTSILKKSKYDNFDSIVEIPKVQKTPKSVVFSETADNVEIDRTIVMRDVVEKVNQSNKMGNNGSRPSSLFKKKRQQMKS